KEMPDLHQGEGRQSSCPIRAKSRNVDDLRRLPTRTSTTTKVRSSAQRAVATRIRRGEMNHVRRRFSMGTQGSHVQRQVRPTGIRADAAGNLRRNPGGQVAVSGTQYARQPVVST